MSWLPSIEKLDPKQRSTVDFVVAQDENFYLEGEAGTGKTVVLAHIAMKYKKENPDSKVALLTYVNALADYIAEGVAGSGVYVQTIIREVNNPKAKKYDLLLIDEAQDIRKEWVPIFKKLGRRFVFAADFDQMIYGRTANIVEKSDLVKDFGIETKLPKLKRDYRLPKSHRELLQITYLGGREFESEITRTLELANVDVYHAKTWSGEVLHVQNFLQKNVTIGKPAAALFDRNNQMRRFLEEVEPSLKEKFDGIGDRSFFDSVNDYLVVHKSQYRYLGRLSDDWRKILAADPHDNMLECKKRPIIYLMTYHGAKGLDFDTVAIPNLGKGGAMVQFNTFYVAMTRCRKKLMLSYHGNAGPQIQGIRAFGKYIDFSSEYSPDPIQSMFTQGKFMW
jgi:superfamily I DNA/RNA helicase